MAALFVRAYGAHLQKRRNQDMIETEAYVVGRSRHQPDHGWVYVVAARKSACDACGVKNGCGTAVFSKVLGRKPARILARNAAGARQGDRVLVGIDESAYLHGSFLLYGIPLLAAGLAALVIRSLIGPGDGPEALAALAGLAGGLVWIRKTRRRLRAEAVVLRRLPEIPVAVGQPLPSPN